MKILHFAPTLTLLFWSVVSAATGATNFRINIDEKPPQRSGSHAGYASIVDKAAPSIVSITTAKNVNIPKVRQFQYMDPFSGRLFRGRKLDPNGDVIPKQKGAGSGVIISQDGYIITNHHVIKDSDYIQVAFENETMNYDAEVIGTDESTDIAVLKIQGDRFPAIDVGTSSNLKAGDFVLAIGSPFGLSRTVTQGIISAVGRTNLGLTGEAGYEDFIQTDASINPGNSGGALVDNLGRMIGINTAIFSRSGGNHGIGFAIPSDLAVNVAEQIIEFGEVQRGYLGVNLGDINADLAKALDVDSEGTIIHEVVPGSPAEKMGLQSGDVVTKYENKMVGDAARLRLFIGATRPQTEVTISVIRNGENKNIKGLIGARDKNRSVTSKGSQTWGGAPKNQLVDGLRLSNIDASVRARLGIPSDINGILIEGVEPNSTAAKVGLRPGEIISEISKYPIKNLEEAMQKKEEILSRSNENVMLLRVLSETGSRFVAVQIS